MTDTPLDQCGRGSLTTYIDLDDVAFDKWGVHRIMPEDLLDQDHPNRVNDLHRYRRD